MDGVGAGSKVVGSADFVRAKPLEEKDDASGAGLMEVHGCACEMGFTIKFSKEHSLLSTEILDCAKEVFDLAKSVFSGFEPDSEVSKINRLPAGTAHDMSAPMREVILAAKEVYNLTRGRFSPAVQPVFNFFEESGKTSQLGRFGDLKASDVSQEVREHLQQVSDFRSAFTFSEDKTKITKNSDEAMLQLHGIAKGWAIDTVGNKLERELGLEAFFIEWAGDVKVKGTHPSGRPWKIAIAEPPSLEKLHEKALKALDQDSSTAPYVRLGTVAELEESPEYLAILDLRDGDAVATSGDYEQVYVNDGRVYSHIMNPIGGHLMEVNDKALSQAVVVLPSCMFADALATAAMACEQVQDARKMLDPFHTGFRKPMSDYLLYARGGPRVVRMTVAGMEPRAEREHRLSLHDPSTVIVVGAGLAGMSAAIEAADCGARVILIEKEPRTGGNSAKATSGINGWGTDTQAQLEVADEEKLFERDTFRSGKGGTSNTSLVRTLSTQSARGIHWLKQRFDIPLSVLSQLGGHSAKRTHRAPPDEHGRPVPIGFLITKTLRDTIEHEFPGKIEIRCGCYAKRLLTNVEEKTGVKTVYGIEIEQNNERQELHSDALILTTGGFGCDRSSEGLMAKYRPDLLGTATTNGGFAVGEGVQMAEAIGADLVDMDKVQLHPTGFIDPKDPSNPTKFLAPEAIRGSGGILVNSDGKRFVNELDLRSVVAAAIQKHCSPYKSETYSGPPFAWCILGAEAQQLFGPPVLSFYKDKLGLWEECSNVVECAKIIGCSPAALSHTLSDYAAAVKDGACISTGKHVFPSSISEKETSLVLARVTPSIHYTMGGVNINAAAEVQELIPNPVFGGHRHIRGLFAAGEVTGGLHGNNRLGGNSLAECVVFGRIAGERAATILNPKPLFFDPNEPNKWIPCIMREVRNTDEKYGKSTREIRFNLHSSLQKTGLKVGQFVAVRGELDGETLTGYFSPITRPDDEGVIGILCRVDEKGGPIVRLLDFLRPGSQIKIRAMGGLRLDVQHDGVFWKGRRIQKFGLLAGGTGIAPMLQILREYCHFAAHDRKYNGGKNVLPTGLNLVYAAEEESDLSYVKVLNDVKDRYPQDFRFYLILNRPPLGWTEGVGFVKPSNIKKNLFFPPADNQLIVICGPPVFENIMVKTLDKLNFSPDHYYSYSME